MSASHENQGCCRRGRTPRARSRAVRLRAAIATVGAHRSGLQAWFATWRGRIGFEITGLRIKAGDDVAFCHALIHLTGSRSGGSRSDVWFRKTLGLIKLGNVWKIARGHESVPMHMDGSFRAAIDLQPQAFAQHVPGREDVRGKPTDGDASTGRGPLFALQAVDSRPHRSSHP